jgi:3-methyladenine DNA glycosylase AlkD
MSSCDSVNISADVPELRMALRNDIAMTAQEILEELEPLGSPSVKKVLMNHGAREPFYGVKIEDLQKFRKRIKIDYQLALDLYDTGVSDAMYLAGLIADDARMTQRDLQKWINGAYWSMLSEYTVPWVAAGGRFGREMGLKWIESKKELIAGAGWATLAALTALKDDADLDLPELEQLLERVQSTIHESHNCARGTMNGFVIAVGSYVEPLSAKALKAAKAIGEVHVDMGNTSCKVPFAPEYIQKVIDRGTVGKKRKTVKC